MEIPSQTLRARPSSGILYDSWRKAEPADIELPTWGLYGGWGWGDPEVPLQSGFVVTATGPSIRSLPPPPESSTKGGAKELSVIFSFNGKGRGWGLAEMLGGKDRSWRVPMVTEDAPELMGIAHENLPSVGGWGVGVGMTVTLHIMLMM